MMLVHQTLEKTKEVMMEIKIMMMMLTPRRRRPIRCWQSFQMSLYVCPRIPFLKETTSSNLSSWCSVEDSVAQLMVAMMNGVTIGATWMKRIHLMISSMMLPESDYNLQNKLLWTCKANIKKVFELFNTKIIQMN